MKLSVKTKLTHTVLSASTFVILIVVWNIATKSGIVEPFFLPSPLDVSSALIKLFTVHNFLSDIVVTIFRIIVGFMIAVLLAVPLGVFMGLSKKLEAFIEPLIDFIRYTPIPAFIPLFILWFGIGELEKIIVIFVAVFFQLVLMVANSISHTPKDIVDFARTLGVSKYTLITKIIYQYAKPKIFDDLRVSMGWAWAGLMIAEIVGATSGIGFVIIQSQRLLRTANVIAAIIVVGIIGLATDWILKKIHQYMFPWVIKAEDYETR